MGIGIRLGLTGQRVNASPASLFTVPGSRGFMFDLSNYATQWQDTAGTVPITGTAQSVARVNDVSGLGNNATQATLGNRPLSVIFPSSGVRNRANGSASVENATYWPATFTQNGITVTKTAFGTDTDGLPYVDMSVSGTATVNDIIDAYSFANSRTPALLGQTFTNSARVQIISGSIPPANCGVRLDVRGETAPSTIVESAFNSVFAPATETALSTSITVANAATNQVRLGLVVRTEGGAAVNYTIRIKGLQFELGATRTAYQFNYSAQNVTEPGFASIRGIQFDGVDDWLQTAAIDFSNSDEVTVVAGVQKLSDAARGTLVELTTGTAGRFSVNAPVSAGANYEFGSVGTVGVGAFVAGFAAPDSAILSGQGKISTDTAILRRNGTQVASVATDQGTGNYSNAIVYIGRRGGTSLPFNGVLTFLFAINRLLTANELASVEAYANARTGAY